MTDPDTRAGRTAVPTIPYRDLPKMIDWLCQAFGFQKQLIVFDNSGSIAHAQLVLGGSMVMVVPAGQGPFDDVLVHPDQVERIATQSTYLLVDDVETRHARATASGAEVMFEMEFNNSAGRGYACRDPEGHIWLIGSYDPIRDPQEPRRGDGRQRRRTGCRQEHDACCGEPRRHSRRPSGAGGSC